MTFFKEREIGNRGISHVLTHKDLKVHEQKVFLNIRKFIWFTRNEKFEKNDMEGCLSPKLRIHFVLFYNFIFNKNNNW